MLLSSLNLSLAFLVFSSAQSVSSPQVRSLANFLAHVSRRNAFQLSRTPALFARSSNGIRVGSILAAEPETLEAKKAARVAATKAALTQKMAAIRGEPEAVDASEDDAEAARLARVAAVKLVLNEKLAAWRSKSDHAETSNAVNVGRGQPGETDDLELIGNLYSQRWGGNDAAVKVNKGNTADTSNLSPAEAKAARMAAAKQALAAKMEAWNEPKKPEKTPEQLAREEAEAQVVDDAEVRNINLRLAQLRARKTADGTSKTASTGPETEEARKARLAAARATLQAKYDDWAAPITAEDYKKIKESNANVREGTQGKSVWDFLKVLGLLGGFTMLVQDVPLLLLIGSYPFWQDKLKFSEDGGLAGFGSAADIASAMDPSVVSSVMAPTGILPPR